MPFRGPIREPLRGEPDWPDANGERPVFLIDASSRLEERLLDGWIERNRPEGVGAEEYDVVRIPASRRRRRGASLVRLDATLASGSGVLLAPLRVAWLPPLRDGRRSVQLRDLLTYSDPRDPDPVRQAWRLRREPDRCRIVAGEPASDRALRERWRNGDAAEAEQGAGLAEFVHRQAVLSLERAERALRGARYKVPHLVREDILGRASFRGGLARLARELQRPEPAVAREAGRYLKEIAAAHDPFFLDLGTRFFRKLYTMGYEETLLYDRDQLREIASLLQRHPVVFLPSHKSNLDHMVLQVLLHEDDFPPTHTAGGINMNFFPLGPLVRRCGVFFIRRTFKDNPVYKFVLQHYVDYLIEKRFSLEWYLEGGRSRSGKLLPPRLGMLAYVVDAYLRGKSEDVVLLPVSIAYDQIQEAPVYAAEQTGTPKERESFGWFVRFIRALRRRYGRIHIRFGEPLSLAKTLGAPSGAEASGSGEKNLAIQKLAFEVAARINRDTPITPTSLLTFALLDASGRAMTLAELDTALENLLLFIRRRNLPTTGAFDLYDPEHTRACLEALVENGVVSKYGEGSEPIYMIDPERQLTAAYYRNSVVHFFVNASIAELALLRAGEEGVEDPAAVFWNACMELRDLLKFEFFFAEKESFRGEIRRELALQDGAWEQHLTGGPSQIRQLLLSFRPYSAHRALRPFLESYLLVAEQLERQSCESPLDMGDFVAQCMRLGKQYHLQRRIHSAASVSQLLIRNALELAANRELLAPGWPELAARRAGFADEVQDAIRRIDAVAALAESRRLGLID